MKVAVTDRGRKIEAAEDAPPMARCPRCGHSVTLRKRRLMNERGFVYYWRHNDGGRLTCENRASYVKRSEVNSTR